MEPGLAFYKEKIDIKASKSIIKKINEKKVNLKEAKEINWNETAEEENEKPKKKGFFKIFSPKQKATYFH